MAGGVVGGYLGYGAALRAEDARNRKLAVAKWGTPPPMSHREQVKQYHRRRRNLGLGILTTAAGSVGAGALAAAHGGHLPRVGPTLARNKGKIERIGLNSALIGGGIGAVQGFQNIGIQHRDLDAKKKELKLSKSAPRLVRTAGFRQSYLRATPRGRVRVANTVTKIDSNHWAEMPALRRAADRTEAEVFPPFKRKLRIRRGTDSKGSVVRRPLSKIDTTMSANDAHSYAHKYGTRGPLPKGLDRDEKMKAYEGRYIVAGGPKGERWHKRADQLDRVTGAALGVGGAAAMGELAAKTKRGTAFLSRRGHGVQAAVHRTNRIGLGAAGVGALSELAHRHAAHKQAAYSNSAAGVAASALRRMRDYTPD